MNRIFKIALVLCLLLVGKKVMAQYGEGPSKPTYFGVQVRPVLASSFMASSRNALETESFTTVFTQKAGYSFGGIVRTGITKLIFFETAINFTQRNYDISLSLPDSGIFSSNELSFVSYDIPLNALVYIQLGEQFFMNSSLGVALRYSPSSVGTVTKPGGLNTFRTSGILPRKGGLDLNANVGFEFRTFDKGFIYVGGTIQVPLTDLFIIASRHEYQGYNNTLYGTMRAPYLALDFKYFFPNIKNKGPQPLRGPIQ